MSSIDNRALVNWKVAGPEASLLPTTIAELTPAFLTAVLSRREAVEVVKADVDELSNGSGTRARLHLEYRQQTDLPKVMWAKSSFHDAREAQRDWGVLEGEARFYQFATAVPRVAVPEAYYAGYDATRNGLVLLEDLTARGAAFGHVTRPVTVEQAKRLVDAMAPLHAAAWDSDLFEGDGALAWLERPNSGPFAEFLMTYSMPLMSRAVAGRRKDVVPEGLKDGEAITEALLRMTARNSQPPHCLLHFDLHVGNTYFDRDGRAGFLDWSLFRKGRWSHDFAYLLISAMTPADRAECERSLLERYLEKLSELGVTDPPSFENAWVAYRESSLYGFFMWLTTPSSMVEDEICRLYVQRFGQAAVELGALEALDSATVHGVHDRRRE